MVLLPVFKLTQAQVEIAKWSFATGQLTDTVQNSTNVLNTGRTIRTEGSSAITLTNGQVTGDYAATATNWDNGIDSKNWNIKFKTTGYTNVKISSKQRSGGTNGGPRDFKLQYKIGSSGAWIDIPGGVVTLANNWTSGVITNLSLPNDCQNQSNSIYVRWIMTSNTDINGGNVTATGISKIDDIIVTGSVLTGLELNKPIATIRTYPNPSTSSFTIELGDNTSQVDIFNSNGKLVYSRISANKTFLIEKTLPSGMYLIKTIGKDRTYYTKHLIE